MLDDHFLLGRWREGDRGAGNELVERYFREITRFFCNKVAQAEDTTELVAQTFLACTTAKDGFREETSFRRFLYALANNVLREYVRKRVKRKAEVDDFADVCVRELYTASPSSLLGRTHELQAFLEGLRLVPLPDQIVLEHHYFSAGTAEEMADVLGIPSVTVRGRLFRARERLRVKVSELMADSGRASEGPTFERMDAWAAMIREQHGWRAGSES